MPIKLRIYRNTKACDYKTNYYQTVNNTYLPKQERRE